MILPTTYLAALLLAAASLFCWGSWANAQKLAGRWRFELYYYDFTVGVALCAVAAAFTLGSLNPADLTFQDNFLLAGYRKIAWGLGAGLVFNLGNLLLVAAIAVSGMAVAFPAAFGVAVTFGLVWNAALGPPGGRLALLAGAVLVAAAVPADWLAYRWRLEDLYMAQQKAYLDDPRNAPSPRKDEPWRGSVLAVLGGILLGAFAPMMEESRLGENGVSPYGLALLLAGAVLASSLLYVPFFLNFPAQGSPIQARQYFKGTKKQHTLGLLGGVMWSTGVLASLAAAGAPAPVQINAKVSYALAQGAPVLGALWGLLAWREFKGSTNRSKAMAAVTLLLMLAGIGVASSTR